MLFFEMEKSIETNQLMAKMTEEDYCTYMSFRNHFLVSCITA